MRPFASLLLLGLAPSISLARTQQTVLDPTGSAASPSYRDDLLALHKALIDIPSITGHENEVGNYLVDYLTSRSWLAQLEFLPPMENTQPGRERFNVLAWRGPSRHPKPKVLVTSHIDTVPPYIPYAISDDKTDAKTVIKGRGSVDAKASVAAQIVAVEELLKNKEVDAKDLLLLYVVGEEVGGEGMRYFSHTLEELDPPPAFKAAIFGEPTQNKLACGHKGHLICNITAHGQAGHSGYPWLGKSATEVLMRSLLKILDTDLGTSEDFGNTTINVGILEGGIASNVIAENASAVLAARVALGPQEAGHLKVRAKMQEVLDSVDDKALEMECHNGYGAVKCDCEVDGFEQVVVNYGTDVPNLKGNHTRYLYGPGDILVAHSDHEQLTVGDLENAVEGYKKLIKHALKS